ncbi:Mov34/MPN/PAD-1 family protein [Parapedobacter sp. GCM10030251]|uniref:Mov34/MPN/PAD-1 family protein n=1 Tax=Parapedobacter sp. GCM10030251 TaxID=3273419 RepID=UPI0036224F3C
MILRIENIGLSLEIGDELLKKLVEKGKSQYPHEFGGFLVGYYADDNRHLHITDMILPQSFKASKYSYERSTKGIEKKLGNYYKETPKKFYVGEWHTHPDNSPIPSMTDITAINTIINNQNACIANPVLLIIGYSKTQIAFGFYVWFENKLYRYE